MAIFRWILAAAFVSTPARADAFDISYGGRLTDAPTGTAVQGPVALELHFYAGESTATEIVPAKTVENVPLGDGVFAVRLPLTAGERATVFDSAEVWIEVRDLTHAKSYPRQRFTGVPYALRVPVDPSTLGYDGNGQLFVKGAAPTASFTQANSQYVATDEIKARDSDGIKISNASGAGMVVANSGNVGIGTTAPTQMLTVAGVVNASKVNAGLGDAVAFAGGDFSMAAKNGLQVLQGSPTDELRIRMSNSDNSLQLAYWNYDPVSDSVLFGSKTASPLRLSVGVERMRIDTAGNVGIGTTNPGTTLDVSSTGARPQIRVGVNGATNAANGLALGDYEFAARYNGSMNEVANIRGFYTGDGTSRSGDLSFFTTDNSAPAERVRISASGKVGIGTTSPAANLQINSIAVANRDVGPNQLFFTDGATARARLVYDTNATRLDLVGPDGTSISRIEGANGQMQITGPIAGSLSLISANNTLLRGNDLLFQNASAADLMRITTAGNVGIGSTAPQATLDVNGYARLAKFAAAPVACDVAHDGSIALSNANYLCLCIAGTGWRRASDGSTACSTW